MDKPLPPSAHKLAELRKKGTVARGTRVSGAIGAVATFATLIVLIPKYFSQLSFGPPLQCVITGGLIGPCIGAVVSAYLMLTVLPLIIGGIAGALAEYLQVGMYFTPTVIGIDGSHLAPSNWLEQLPKQCWAGIVQFLVVTLFLLLSITLLWGMLSAVDRFLAVDPLLPLVWGGLLLLGVLLVTAGFDWWWSRKKFLQQHSMSLDEARREFREQEGDPLLKAVREAQHHALLVRTIEERVKKAKVVIVS